MPPCELKRRNATHNSCKNLGKETSESSFKIVLNYSMQQGRIETNLNVAFDLLLCRAVVSSKRIFACLYIDQKLIINGKTNEWRDTSIEFSLKDH